MKIVHILTKDVEAEGGRESWKRNLEAVESVNYLWSRSTLITEVGSELGSA